MKRFATPVLLFFAVAAHAQIVPVEWETAVTESAAALSSGQYMKAYAVDDRVLNDMVRRLSFAQPPLFATLVVHKAAALAGLGHVDDARWYWNYAQFLSPDIADSPDTIALGRGVEILKRSAPQTFANVKRVGGEVKPPRTISRVDAVYPEGARRKRVSGAVILECIVDKSGAVREGRVLKGLPVPTFGYSALEAVRRWKFHPATIGGEPVDVIFKLTLNFKFAADEDKPQP